MEPVSWSVTPTTSPPLRWAAYAVLGLFGGMVGLVGAILFALGVERLGGGDSRLLALLVVLGAVGGGLAVLYLRPMLFEPAARPAAISLRFERLDWQWLAVSSLAGAAALWFLARVSALAALAAVALAALAFAGLLWAGRNEGTVDPANRTLTYRGRGIDLVTVARTATYGVGRARLLRLSYEPGASGPRLLILPAAAARAVREAVAGGDPVDADAAGSGSSADRPGNTRR